MAASELVSRLDRVSDEHGFWSFIPTVWSAVRPSAAAPHLRQKQVNDVKFGAELIVGGGHACPGGVQYLGERWIGEASKNIEASEVIWELFSTHPR
jgi:hypothetical protein